MRYPNAKRKPIKKSFARETISKFLPNEWTSVKDSDLVITQVQNGMINTSFIVENKAAVNDPSKVLFRKYGGGIYKNKYKSNTWLPMNSEAEEGLICHQQSKSGNGPKVYGFFPGGRVEEFIPSHTLGHDEAVQPEIMKDLARAYARYHYQEKIPIDKTRYDKLFEVKPHSTFVFKHPRLLDCWMSFFSCCCRQPSEKGLRFDSFLALDIAVELKLMKQVIAATKSKHVLLHSDTQYLNVLVRDEPSSENKLKTVLVDYEVSLYGPRLLDIAGHFSARMFGQSGLSGYEIPNEEERRLFVKFYSQEIRKLDPDNFDQELDNEDHLMMEADVGLAAGRLTMMATMLPFTHFFLFVPHILKFFSMLTDSGNGNAGAMTVAAMNQPGGPQQGSVMMVYGMEHSKMNADRLFNLLCLYGNVVRIKFLKSKEGCAMVQMGDPAAVEKCVQSLNNLQFFGKKMQLGYSKQAFLNDVQQPFDLPDGSPSFKDFMGNRNNRFTNPEAAVNKQKEHHH